jgi:hypothetical protein
MNSPKNFAVELANALEFTLDFVQNKNASNDIDLLIVIQTFIQQISFNLKKYLDPSIIVIHF